MRIHPSCAILLRRSLFLSLAFSAAGLVASGCSDTPNTPKLIAGGGATGGPIEGALFVYVIEEGKDSSATLAGATVQVSSTALGTPQSVVTDATGLARLELGALEGPQTVTVSAAGHVPATWYGINARNLTVPLRPSSPPAPASAQVGGTIAGWAALPEPAPGHRTVALISYSKRFPLDSAENSIETPNRTLTIGAQSFNIPGNSCVRSTLVTDCNFQLTTRIGKQAIYAIVIDTDTKNTLPENDDTNTVIGYAVLRGVDALSGQSLTGLTLAQVPMTDIVNTAVNFGTPPAGMMARSAFSIVDLGEEGVVPTSLVTPTMPAAVLPKLVGAFAGQHLDLIAGADDNAATSSTLFVRDIDPTVSINLTDWLPAPGTLAVTATTLSFAPVSGATLHTVEARSGDGTRRWSAAVFDGSATITLPTLTPDPFAGTLGYLVAAVRAPELSPTSFVIADVDEQIRATGNATTTFSR